MFYKKFDFRAGATCSEDTVAVEGGRLYVQGNGFGFVTEENFEKQPELRMAELNSGFEPAPWYRGSALTCIGQDIYGCYIDQREWAEQMRQIPLRFKCDARAAGCYRITVTVNPAENMKDVRIFVGRRQLVAYEKECRAGEKLKCQAVVNLSGIIPRGQEKAFDDRSIDLTVTADRPCISGLEIEAIDCPVLYIGGDSTVTDQPAEYPYAPEMSYAGWGQMLSCFLTPGAAVSNHSHSGLTTESFRQEGHYAVVQKYAKAGDYLFLQFGHNDQKLAHLKAREGYWDNLAAYVKECREGGIYPLIVTPVARNSWKGNDGSYNDLLEEYADACIWLGKFLHVPVIDLHRLSRDFVTGKGKEGAKRFFYPSDFTHHNDFGAYIMASFVCSEIVRTCAGHENPAYQKLAGYVKRGREAGAPRFWGVTGRTEPAAGRGIDMGEPRRVAPLAKPEGYAMLSAAEALFEELERPEDVLLRAEAMDMVIKSAGFFRTNVYNDYFDDVVGHEWYAGTVECALENGILVPEACDGKLCHPGDAVTLEHFLVFAMNGYLSRRAAPPEKSCLYDSACSEWAKPYIRMAHGLGVLAQDGSDRMQKNISRRCGAGILKQLKIL